LLKKNFTKEKIGLILSFIENHVKFAKKENSLIFEEKIDEMVKYETTQDILDHVNPAKRAIKAENALAKALKAKSEAIAAKEQERQAKELSIILMLNNGIEAATISDNLKIPIPAILEIYDRYKAKN
jgi:hypothetical protein